MDCRDSDCRSVCVENCADGIDNDGARRIDCEDSECADSPSCPEICDDGVDNDQDGRIDCTDSECEDDAACPVEYGGRGGIVESLCKNDENCADDTLEIVFENGQSTLRVSKAPVTIPIRVVTETRSYDVYGWSYAVRHDETVIELIADSATTTGTIGDPDAVGPRSVGFDATQAVPGGFISAIVLSFLVETELPIGERNVICLAEYQLPSVPERPIRLDFVSDEIGANGRNTDVNFTIGRVGALPARLYQGLILPSDSPVEDCEDGIDNDGDDATDCADSDCSHLSVCGIAAFRRGDANGDGRINISDVVPLLRFALGREVPRFDCEEAFDTNDDGAVNVSDAIPLVSWLFLDGPPLVGPFRDCGTRGDCLESSPGCSI
ncbi:MAG: dockerin type I repeat-containing protein [Planctomycetota bacterium]